MNRQGLGGTSLYFSRVFGNTLYKGVSIQRRWVHIDVIFGQPSARQVVHEGLWALHFSEQLRQDFNGDGYILYHFLGL